jgi:hypothetical protein
MKVPPKATAREITVFKPVLEAWSTGFEEPVCGAVSTGSDMGGDQRRHAS